MENCLKECKVLVVDDNTYLLMAIALILNHSGISCKTLDNPKNIFNAINEFAPDVLLMDVNMPDVDGRNICRRIKKDTLYFSMPIILISGSLMDAASVADAGADNFIQKPFENNELTSMIISSCLK